ncbi:alpha-1,3-galactosidase-related protein, partial [Flavobacterium sp.]|uniref:alpha-1,3-galactosidase-related protein n=1 Tax=Flavobacterium sp. TaxID=239 RepID=UPI003C3B7AA5
KIALQHWQQFGIEFAGIGDEVWFIQNPSPQRGTVNEVVSVKVIDETYSILKFKNKIPTTLKANDILENKTWNPSFTMRGCRITKLRARNMMLKTPLKIIIENNYLSSEMSSIGFKGETLNWFESGAVEDVIIRKNHFVDCAHGGAEHSVLWIAPTLGKSFNQTEIYDRNILFEDNLIDTFDNRIVWAERVDGLTIKNNTIKQTTILKQLYPKAYLFDLENCKNVSIIGNKYEGTATKFIKTDKASEPTLVIKNNNGF